MIIVLTSSANRLRARTHRLHAMVAFLTITSLVVGQRPDTPRRVRTPKWQSTDTRDVFFEDALREGLRGPRPGHLGLPSTARVSSSQPQNDRKTKADGFVWSRLVSAASLEDQVKLGRIELDQSIRQPAQFANGEHRQARRQFVMLATWFAVIHEYDAEVRWKSDAAAARDRFRKAGQAAQVGSLAAFQTAKSARDDLTDLISGNPMDSTTELTEQDWSQITDRGVLMNQLEISFDQVLQPGTALSDTFRGERAAVQRHAELIAAVAEILTREGLEDAGDDDYVDYCRQIQAATVNIRHAVRSQDAEAARQATGEIHKACSACHESYRG